MLTMLFSLLIYGFAVQAQLPSYLPEGLHKLTEEELMYEDLSLVGLPLYFNGKRLSYKEGPKMNADPAYMLDYYANKVGEIKAVVIRPSTAEERAIKEDPNYQPDPAAWKNGLPPEFTVEDLDGKLVDLAEFEGKVVVLNFWFVGCKPCVQEMPELNALVKKYDKEEVVFLAFATDKAPVVKQFLSKKVFNYRIIPRARHIAKKFGIHSYPTHYVIDKEGIVRLYQRSYSPGTGNRIDFEIARLLKK